MQVPKYTWLCHSLILYGKIKPKVPVSHQYTQHLLYSQKHKDANRQMRNAMTGSSPASLNHKTILNVYSEKFSAAQGKTTGLITGVPILRSRDFGCDTVQFDPKRPPSVTAGWQPVKSENIWLRSIKNKILNSGLNKTQKSQMEPSFYQCHCEDRANARSRDAKSTDVIPRQSIWPTVDLQPASISKVKPTSGNVLHKNKHTCGLRLGKLCYLVGPERGIY